MLCNHEQMDKETKGLANGLTDKPFCKDAKPSKICFPHSFIQNDVKNRRFHLFYSFLADRLKWENGWT